MIESEEASGAAQAASLAVFKIWSHAHSLQCGVFQQKNTATHGLRVSNTTINKKEKPAGMRA